MFRNYLATALRNLERNKLYAGINIIGITLGFVAVLFIALFVRDELTFDAFIPGHEDVYRLAKTIHPAGSTISSDGSGAIEAEWVKQEIPGVQAVTRLWPEEHGLRHGEVEANEVVVWTDPTVFDVFPFAAAAGDVKVALARPDTAVITRRLARKYFGRDDVVGEILEVDRKASLQITAVMETLPSNSHLNLDVLASSASSIAPFAAYARSAAGGRIALGPVLTYVRLAPGARAGFEDALTAMVDRHVPPQTILGKTVKGSEALTYHVQPLRAIHMLTPQDRNNSNGNLFKPAGEMATVTASAITGALILAVALANFINLMSARASRRAIEVGVRKTSGAQRLHLLVQFMGESFAYVLASLVVAITVVEITLPSFNGCLDRAIAFDYLRDPILRAGIFVLLLATGIAGGIYPALVLSAFRPAAVLKSGAVTSQSSGLLRRILVVGQFAILISLMVAAAVIGRQTAFGMTQSLRFNDDPMIFIATTCRDAFKDQLKALPGVKGAACARSALIGGPNESALTAMPDGSVGTIEAIGVEPGLLELYGLKPVAGRFPTSSDIVAPAPGVVRKMVVNETTIRRLQFPSAAAAIGKPATTPGKDSGGPAHMGTSNTEIIGVVPDFPIRSVREAIPMLAFAQAGRYEYLVVKLDGAQVGSTLQAVDGLWEKLGTGKPIQRQFFDQHIQAQYIYLVRQTQAFIVFAVTAVFIAGLGLFGLCVFTAERRTKEIGIRKAMGASRGDITRLLLWEFIRPVAWATVIAWPLGYFAMHQWLDGFAYRVELDPGIFVAASAAAAAIAASTIIVQVARVARAEPVAALRYE
ncbi:MAG: ABC transporter permease [Rhodospirillaceae bacterium]